MITDLKMEGVGIFWCLIEMLYEENGYLSLSLCERIANALRTHSDIIKSLINNYDLFKNDGERFWSESVLRRLNERQEKSEKARKSALSKYINKKDNSERKRTHSERKRTLAIKERKGKEIKEKEIKEIKVKEITSTIVEGDKPSEYGNQNINNLLKEFETIMGFKSAGGVKDRIMATHLLKNFSAQQLTYMLTYCATEKYAPRIGSLEKLWHRRGDIIAGIKNLNNNPKVISI